MPSLIHTSLQPFMLHPRHELSAAAKDKCGQWTNQMLSHQPRKLLGGKVPDSRWSCAGRMRSLSGCSPVASMRQPWRPRWRLSPGCTWMQAVQSCSKRCAGPYPISDLALKHGCVCGVSSECCAAARSHPKIMPVRRRVSKMHCGCTARVLWPRYGRHTPRRATYLALPCTERILTHRLERRMGSNGRRMESCRSATSPRPWVMLHHQRAC